MHHRECAPHEASCQDFPRAWLSLAPCVAQDAVARKRADGVWKSALLGLRILVFRGGMCLVCSPSQRSGQGSKASVGVIDFGYAQSPVKKQLKSLKEQMYSSTTYG